MERNMSLRSSSITSERMEELRRKRMEARQASNGEAAVTSVTPELERRATARCVQRVGVTGNLPCGG